MARLEPLATCTDSALRNVRIVLTDVDGTLTRNGMLPATSVQAIADLAGAGIKVVPVTGRPAGWAHVMMHQWPVPAAIAENGAMAYVQEGNALREVYALGIEGAKSHAEKVKAIAAEALKAFPSLRLASDQPYRLVDLAIDHAERVDPLSVGELARLRAFLENEGAQVIVSSIHVHIQVAEFDKAAMAKQVINDYLGPVDTDAVLAIGDAPNDEPLFKAFPLSVGVANIADAAPGMTHLPRYICDGAEADGFCELAARLIAART